MENKHQKVLILIHDSDDEDERKKNIQDTVEMRKKKDSHIISNKKVDDEKKMIDADVDPAYAQFCEMIMAAEHQCSQQPEGCFMTNASKRTKSTNADKNKGKTRIIDEGGLLSKGHVNDNNYRKKKVTSERSILSRGHHVDINIGKKNSPKKYKFGRNDIRYSISPSRDSSSSDTSSSDEDVQLQQQAEPIKRGPHYGGSCLFDKHCIFANYMELTKVQCKGLNTKCKDRPDALTKHYVYKMTESSVHRKKAKMDFGAEFTKKSLLKFIEKKPIEIDVCSATSSKTFKVTLKLGEGSNKAMLSAGWATAVKGFDMTPGQIYVFMFGASTPTALELTVALL